MRARKGGEAGPGTTRLLNLRLTGLRPEMHFGLSRSQTGRRNARQTGRSRPGFLARWFRALRAVHGMAVF